MTESKSWLLFALLLLGGLLLWLLAPVITPFAVAATIAYLTDPLVDRLELIRIKSWQMSRSLAVTLVFVLLTFLLVIALLVVIPALIRQARSLVDQVPAVIDWVTVVALPWVSSRWVRNW